MAHRNQLDYNQNSNTQVDKIETRNDIETEYLNKKAREEKELVKEVAEYKFKLEKTGIVKNEAERERLAKKLENTLRKEKQKQDKKEIDDLIKYEQNKRKKAREEEQKQKIQDLEDYIEKQKQLVEDGKTDVFSAWAKSAGASIKSQLGDPKWQAKKMNDALNNIANKASALFNQVAQTYSKYQTAITTRLQGSGKSYNSLQTGLLNTIGITPYIKTQTMLDNLNSLVEQGIAYNLEQRAFLQTVAEKVATTFDAANASLLQIVKLQQSDSTASRLGMESYLTRFLNSMFENTEYLSNEFDNVTSALIEASSQLPTDMGVEFEYIVQKWLGSLSSVGLSSGTTTGLASALGALVTGDVSSLSSSPLGNLIVMAASRAGLSYGDMLTRSISLDETNALLESVVTYLQEIGSSTNQVVKNQFASTFGVSVSDLKAASNLRGLTSLISSSNLSYGGSIAELRNQVSSIGSRMSTTDLINTVLENAQFSLFQNIASTPALAAMFGITDMIQEYTGGINIPSIFAVGTGADLETTVENLMKLSIMGVGSLGMIGDVISGIGNTVNFGGVLSKLGIGNDIYYRNAAALPTAVSGTSTSSSKLLGQSSGSAFYEATLSKARGEAAQELSGTASQGKIMASEDVDMKTQVADVLSKINTNIESLKLKIVDGVIDVNIKSSDISTIDVPGLS